MEFDANKNLSTKSYNPKTSNIDVGWGEAIGLQYKQDMVTDMSFSQNLQYNKTISKILGYSGKKEEDARSAWTAFGDWATDWGTPDSGFTKESIKYYDELLNSGKIAFDDNGNQIKGDKNPDAKVWWEIKKQGYTPKTFNDEVINNSRQEIMEYASQLKTADSTSAQIVGSFSAWASDPVNFSLVVAEIGGLILTKKPGGAAFINKMLRKHTAIGANKKWASKIEQMIMDRTHEVARIRAGEAVKKFGKKPYLQMKRFEEDAIERGLNPIQAFRELQRAQKAGLFGKNNDKIGQMIAVRKSKDVGNIAGDIGFYTGAGIIAEGIHQATTFDFKNEVLPEYDKTAATTDVLLSGVFAGSVGGTMDLGSRWLYNRRLDNSLDAMAVPGVESTAEIIDGLNKAANDVSKDDLIRVDTDNPPMEFDGVEIPQTQIDEYLEAAQKDPEWEPINNVYEKELNEYDTVKQCIIGNQ